MCLNPISLPRPRALSTYVNVGTIRHHLTSYNMQVPCGKCLECKKQYQNDWAIRIIEESKDWRYMYHVTLTYSNKTVPLAADSDTGEVFLDVCKDDVQKWLKRFRRWLDYRSLGGFKYFLTSEYGPRTLRPHYHIIFMFNFSPVFLHQKALGDWQNRFGFVYAREVENTDKRTIVAKYVAKYCSKGVFESPLVKQNKVSKTFHLISKKLGYRYAYAKYFFHTALDVVGSSVSRFDVICRERLKYVMDGFSYSLPRYYRTLFFPSKTEMAVQLQNGLLRRSYLNSEEQFRTVQTEVPSWSPSQVFIEIANREQNSREHRAQVLFEKYKTFYASAQYA